MKADEVLVGELFKASNQLKIPLWQRSYSWEKSQVEELWADLERVKTSDLDGHFLGSVVLEQLRWSGMPGESRQFWVVDGQQRVTTLTVLVCALRDAVAEAKYTEPSERSEEVAKITSQLLRNNDLGEGHRERLVLQEGDQEALASVVNGAVGESKHHRIQQAYHLFRGKLKDKTCEELAGYLSTVLSKLTAVWVVLEENDNAHRVFQTLNAGGKKLRQVDLVRNYFFLLLGESSDSFYQQHWAAMEKRFGEADFDAYLVSWTITNGHSGSKDSLFGYFKKDLISKEADSRQVKEYGRVLARTSELFFGMKHPSMSSYGDNLKVSLQDLSNWSGGKASAPADGLVLFFLRMLDDKRVKETEACDAVETVLSFMARRHLAGYEPNLHKSIFVNCARQLVAWHEKGGKGLAEYLAYLLATGTERQVWPHDEEITGVAKTNPVYTGARAGWSFGVLERVNREMFKTKKHRPGPIDRSEYSVEHVMPQVLSDGWKTAFEDWGVENPDGYHQTHLHVLGNLTLTKINAELQNKTFEEKKVMLQDDTMKLNEEVCSAGSWPKSRIDERSMAIARYACKAFVAPLGADEVSALRARYGEASQANVDVEEDEDGDSEV